MIQRVLGKKRVESLTRAGLDQLRAGKTRTVVDVGTGDARHAYALASAHEDWFVIAIDALDEPMHEVARKATRKPARGGRANLVLVRASAESLPDDLAGVADEVSVLLPWGRLLEGIVTGDDAIVRGLASLVRGPGGRVEVVLNGEIWAENTPARFAALPDATPDHVARVVAPAFAKVGITIEPARWLTAEEARALTTTWARRLSHGREHPAFLRFVGFA